MLMRKLKTLVVSYLNLLKELNFSGYFEKEEKRMLGIMEIEPLTFNIKSRSCCSNSHIKA